MTERHRGQRLTFAPEQRQGQPTQHGKHRCATQQQEQQADRKGPQRQRLAIVLAGKQPAQHGQEQGRHPQHRCRLQPPGEAQSEQQKTKRHGHHEPSARNAVGNGPRHLHFSQEKSRAGLRQHPAQHRRTHSGVDAGQSPQTRIVRTREAGTE